MSILHVPLVLICLLNYGEAFLELNTAALGNPTAPSLPVAFSTALQKTLTIDAQQTLVFDKVLTNVGNGYDLQSGKFTAPVKGLYLITATALNFYHVSPTLEIVQNNISLVDLFLDGSGHQNSAMTQTLILMLNKGDLVWVRSKTDAAKLSGSAGQPTGVYNTFSGYCIQYIE
ncbi:C1QL [Mytilus coruscus]|uniref:C1QL n=1 Tax=Mytilus coruscus TaxID=42192 RepID=A0A6J8BDT0_MYTCO|nr:C1QL [Mytilus coruscus]